MQLRIGKVVVACLLALGIAGCSNGDDQVQQRDKSGAIDAIATGKYFLTKFEGRRARDNFQKVVTSDWYENGGKKDGLYCEAMYGVILADAQRFLTQVNSLLGTVLKTVIAPAPGVPAGSFSLAAKAPLSEQFDFGELLDPAWRGSLEPILTEMAEYADEVTRYEATVANCGFDIGVDLEESEKGYLYVLNLGEDRRPLFQVQFKGRIDGSEARVINSFVRTVLAGVDFLLAHDMSMTLDLQKIGYILGLPVECLPEEGLACFNDGFTLALQDLPGLAFLLEDNPNLLAKNDARWYRMERIDNTMVSAFYGMRSFFQSLLVRDSRAESVGGDVEERMKEYLISYRDRNDNGQVDSADTFGINIEGITCDPSHVIEVTQLGAEDAASLRSLCKTIEDAVSTLLLNMLRNLSGLMTNAVVEELTTFNERAYANMVAVEKPDHEYQRIPISSFNETLAAFPIQIIGEPMLPWLEFDVASFFTEPRALRSFMPYWEETPSFTGARFLIDSDDYSALDSTGATVVGNLNELMFTVKNSEAGYTDITLLEERDLFQGSYAGGTLTGLTIAADCLNAENLYIGDDTERTYLPVFGLAMQDPTFNGLAWVNLGEWRNRYGFQLFENPDTSNVACNDPMTVDLATNYSLNKGTWIFIKHFIDNLEILSLMGSL